MGAIRSSCLPRSTAALARAILLVRQDRRTILPTALFGGELAYELLLRLFVADAQGERMTGARLLADLGGSQRTGSRWIEYLTREKLIVGDGDGRLDDVLTLTPVALHALERWLSGAGAILSGALPRGSDAEADRSF